MWQYVPRGIIIYGVDIENLKMYTGEFHMIV